ncbi:MAG: winged helix DNA-binding domain-containing protein [Propionibacteriaceae bacterium]|jgi:hypothetical protein|nr:winged helix DNA-binding domain-containing protein [Propionibacteriaceae bacterium]
MLSRRDLLDLRLRSLLVTGGPVGGPAQVAGRFLAMQAQDFPASLWAVGSRSGVSLAEVERAYCERRIVRSWPLRGTIHVTPAEDVGWLRRLTAAKVLGAAAERRRARLGLTVSDLERVRESVVELMSGGVALSRDALLERVAAGGVRLADQWRYHLIWFLAQTGTLLFGPITDGQPALVLADEWVERPRDLGREEGLAELAARYVASHGPATADDLVWWSGLGKREVAQALALAGERVERLEADDGTTYWISPTLPAGRAQPSLALLPAFDEHLLGYRDRTLSLDPAHAPAVCPGGNGIFRPTVVADGVCLGTWSAPARGALSKLPSDRPVPLTVTWFDQESARRADPALLAAAADHYARYLGRERATVAVAPGGLKGQI